MNEEMLPHHIAACAKIYGFLSERRYRNYCIKQEFYRLKNAGKKIEKIELELSEKFSSEKYPLTPESIHDIIYRKTDNS